MTPHDLRQLETIDLAAKVKTLEEELFKIRFQHATAQLSDPTKITKARRLLARAKTILREREMAEQTA